MKNFIKTPDQLIVLIKMRTGRQSGCRPISTSYDVASHLFEVLTEYQKIV